jgi:hypothetical protein
MLVPKSTGLEVAVLWRRGNRGDWVMHYFMEMKVDNERPCVCMQLGMVQQPWQDRQFPTVEFED